MSEPTKLEWVLISEEENYSHWEAMHKGHILKTVYINNDVIVNCFTFRTETTAYFAKSMDHAKRAAEAYAVFLDVLEGK